MMSPSNEELKTSIISKLQPFDVRKMPQYTEPLPASLKKAAVLMPIKVCDGEIHILITKRSSSLRMHASDGAFPGGMVEESDLSIEDAALREAKEEIGLPPSSVEIVAVLSRSLTMNKVVVYPVVGIIQKDFEPVLNLAEVDFMFYLPLKDFLSQEKVTKSIIKFKHFQYVNREVVYSDGIKLARVWGLTGTLCTYLAKILLGKADFMEIYVGQTNTGNILDCIEEYFKFCYEIHLSEFKQSNSKL